MTKKDRRVIKEKREKGGFENADGRPVGVSERGERGRERCLVSRLPVRPVYWHKR